MAELRAMQPKHPTVHAAQPPPLKSAGATAAFRVSDWKREAIEFQQLLDRLLDQHRQPEIQAGSPPTNAAAHGGVSGPPAVGDAGAAESQAAAVTAPPLPLPVLDASELRLATVQEELIRELAAESRLVRQGKGQGERQEDGTAAVLVQAAAGGEQEHPLLLALGGQPLEPQMQQGNLLPAPPLLLSVPWPGHLAGPAASLPMAGGSAAAVAAADGSEQQQQPLIWEPRMPQPLQGGSLQLPQALQFLDLQQEGAAAEPADGVQQQRQQQQPWQAQQAQQQGSVPLAHAAGSVQTQQQQQREQPIQGALQHRLGQPTLAPAALVAPVPAPAVRGEEVGQVLQQQPQPQQEQLQGHARGLQGACEQQQQQQQPQQQQGQPVDGAAAMTSDAGRQQEQEEQQAPEQQQQQAQQEQADVPAQQTAPLPAGEASQEQAQQQQHLQQHPVAQAEAAEPEEQPAVGRRPVAQAEPAEQPVVGRRQRKRPRWLDDMADLVPAGLAPAQQPPAQQQPAQHPPARPQRRREKQHEHPAPLQQAVQEEQQQSLALPQPGEQQQQVVQMPLLPLPALPPLPPLPAVPLPTNAAAAEAAAAAGAGPVPDWDALLASMFGPAGMFAGQQVLPLLSWPLVGDLLQLNPLQLAGQGDADWEEQEGDEEEAARRQRGGGKKGGKGGKKGGKPGGKSGSKSGGGGAPGGPKLTCRTAAQVAAAHVLKPERAAALEAYRQRAEAARERRMEQRQAAGRLLASIAGSELAPSLTWMLLQDARSRQLQAVARAAAEAAALEDSEAGGSQLDWVEGNGEREVVLQVALHVPHSAHFVSEEWLVLGSQRLCELRDRLFCVSDDNLAAVEKEENAYHHGRGQPEVELRRPSAYLYVEGTFYNDMRQPGAVDYSEPIRRYNREQGIEAPPHPPPGTTRADVKTTEFSTARMQDARFDSLWLRLGSGAGNLYCHQGGCEHLLTFQDVRLFDPTCDPPLRRHYPFRLTKPQHTIIRDCEVCGTHTAKRVTYDDRAAPHTPFFWCEDCFRSMHYDEKGSAVYDDYRVFPYVQEYPANILTTQSGPRRGRGAAAASAAAAAAAAVEHVN